MLFLCQRASVSLLFCVLWAMSWGNRNQLAHALNGNGVLQSSPELIAIISQLVVILQQPNGIGALQSFVVSQSKDSTALPPESSSRRERSRGRSRNRTQSRSRSRQRSTSRVSFANSPGPPAPAAEEWQKSSIRRGSNARNLPMLRLCLQVQNRDNHLFPPSSNSSSKSSSILRCLSLLRRCLSPLRVVPCRARILCLVLPWVMILGLLGAVIGLVRRCSLRRTSSPKSTRIQKL